MQLQTTLIRGGALAKGLRNAQAQGGGELGLILSKVQKESARKARAKNPHSPDQVGVNGISEWVPGRLNAGGSFDRVRRG